MHIQLATIAGVNLQVIVRTSPGVDASVGKVACWILCVTKSIDIEADLIVVDCVRAICLCGCSETGNKALNCNCYCSISEVIPIDRCPFHDEGVLSYLSVRRIEVYNLIGTIISFINS